jgi:WD40 repeat protein/serine/threonine protein kinase
MTDTISNDANQPLRTMAIGDPQVPQPELIQDPNLEKPGDEIGPYKLVSLLGEGGFGSVWLAERRQPFLLRVALKIIKPGMDSKAVVTRFEQERQTLAVMNHPNVARVLDGGLSPRGLPYFAMEFVKGQPITDYCDAHRLGTRDRLRLFLQVCDAIQHAHSKGIIHRDLKPGNVMVVQTEGDEAHAKVIDFGVAKALTQHGDDEIMASEAGAMVGTPEYMSPEQAESDADLIDTRSDVYSLGVILYELLTGLLPFDSTELRSKGYREIQRIIRDERPPSASTRLSTIVADAAQSGRIAQSRQLAFETLVAELRRELEWIPLKAMQREPRHRYPTASALADDIRNYLDGRALDAAPDSAGYRLRKYVGRNRALVAASAAVLTALVAGLAAATWQWREATRAKDEALASEARAIEERKAADTARLEATRAKDEALASEARALREKEAADAARRRVEENAYLANIQMGHAWLATEQRARLRERLGACPPSRRGWEWSWLDAQRDRSLAELGGHASDVYAVAASPDGKRVATGSYDNTAMLWDAASGTPLETLKGHTKAVLTLAFSPDGTRLATGSADGTARLWDGRTGEPRQECKGLGTTVTGVTFDAAGRRVLTVSDDGIARVLNAESGATELELKGHEGPLMAGEWLPEDRRVITAAADRTARIWDVNGQAAPLVLSGHAGAVLGLAVQTDGRRVATVSQDGTARVWNAADGACLLTLKGHEGPVVKAAFSPDGQRLATASSDGTARVWDAASGAQLSVSQGHTKELMAVTFDATGRRLLTASLDGSARVWDAATGLELATLVGHEAGVPAARFLPGDERVVTASLDGRARIWDAATPPVSVALEGHGGLIYTVAFSPNGRELATACNDRTVRLWDLASGTSRATLQGHGGPVFAAAYSPDGQRLLTACGDGTARIWNLRTGALARELRGHTEAIRTAAFLPDGHVALTGSNDGSARLWNVESGALLHELKGHADRVSAVTASPDGKRVATASRDRTACIWDAGTGQKLATLAGHAEPVLSIAFSPDGSRVVTGSQDRSARIWDAALGTSIAELKGHGQAVRGVAFSPDGQRVLTISGDGTARLWSAKDGEALQTLRGSSDALTFGTFSPDGTAVLTTGVDGTARVWDAASGTPLATLSGHTEGLSAAAFSPDGTRIATASADRSARVWDSVPHRIRMAEAQFDRQGRRDPLGPLQRAEFRGTSPVTWVTDPSREQNRPSFIATAGSPPVSPSRLGSLIRSAISARNPRGAVQTARAWGTADLDAATLNSLAWNGATRLEAGDPDRNLDESLNYALTATRLTDRRDASMLDTLARVHWERGETPEAVAVERDAVALLEAGPVLKNAAEEATRQKLLSDCRETLARYEAGPRPTAR